MITSQFVFALGLFIYMFIYLIDTKIARKRDFIFFYIYFLCVITTTLFPMPLDINNNYEFRIDNKIPFKNIIYMLDYYPTYYLVKNVIGNIIMFIPFGYIYSQMTKRKTKLLHVTIYCMLFSTFIETMQLIICNILKANYRVVDIDDIILNVMGGVLGFWIAKVQIKIVNKIKKRIEKIEKRRKEKLETSSETI